MKNNLLLISNDVEFNKKIEMSNKINIMSIFSDLIESMCYINNNTDGIESIIIHHNVNGNIVTFLNSIKNEANISKIIIIDNEQLDLYKQIDSKYQIFSILNDNSSLNDIEETILKLSKTKQEEDNRDDVLERITDISRRLGLCPNKTGYHYLRSCIYECYKDRSLLTGVTKGLYPKIAKLYGKTPENIERSIRTAIDTSMSKGLNNFSEELFGKVIGYERYKPTNMEVISTIVDILLLQDGKL